MKFFSFLLLLLIGSGGCHNANNQTGPAKIIHRDTAPSVAIVPKVIVKGDTLIQIRFGAADTGTIASAQSYIDGNKHIVCEVAIAKADSIHASVAPEEATGNVRFSQIFMPDGKADGPFGQILTYATPQPGTYKLIIGENMMAGDKWKGRFRIKVWVK